MSPGRLLEIIPADLLDTQFKHIIVVVYWAVGDGGRWALVSPDGVVPIRLVGVCLC